MIRLAVMLYVRFPLSLRNVEDLLHERGIDVSHETIRYWSDRLKSSSNWQWHLDEVFVKVKGVRHYMWRAVTIADWLQLGTIRGMFLGF